MQHDELNKLNSSSLNTIRVYSILKNDKVEIINALFRMGRKGSPVDNFHAGGIVAGIDLNTGCINTVGRDLEHNAYLFHPDSKITLEGYQIPKWKDVIETVNEIALVTPELRYIAWDFAITDDSIEVIEENTRGCKILLQWIDKVGKKHIFTRV